MDDGPQIPRVLYLVSNAFLSKGSLEASSSASAQSQAQEIVVEDVERLFEPRSKSPSAWIMCDSPVRALYLSCFYECGTNVYIIQMDDLALTVPIFSPSSDYVRKLSERAKNLVSECGIYCMLSAVIDQQSVRCFLDYHAEIDSILQRPLPAVLPTLQEFEHELEESFRNSFLPRSLHAVSIAREGVTMFTPERCWSNKLVRIVTKISPESDHVEREYVKQSITPSRYNNAYKKAVVKGKLIMNDGDHVDECAKKIVVFRTYADSDSESDAGHSDRGISEILASYVAAGVRAVLMPKSPDSRRAEVEARDWGIPIYFYSDRAGERLSQASVKLSPRVECLCWDRGGPSNAVACNRHQSSGGYSEQNQQGVTVPTPISKSDLHITQDPNLGPINSHGAPPGVVNDFGMDPRRQPPPLATSHYHAQPPMAVPPPYDPRGVPPGFAYDTPLAVHPYHDPRHAPAPAPPLREPYDIAPPAAPMGPYGHIDHRSPAPLYADPRNSVTPQFSNSTPSQEYLPTELRSDLRSSVTRSEMVQLEPSQDSQPAHDKWVEPSLDRTRDANSTDLADQYEASLLSEREVTPVHVPATEAPTVDKVVDDLALGGYALGDRVDGIHWKYEPDFDYEQTTVIRFHSEIACIATFFEIQRKSAGDNSVKLKGPGVYLMINQDYVNVTADGFTLEINWRGHRHPFDYKTLTTVLNQCSKDFTPEDRDVPRFALLCHIFSADADDSVKLPVVFQNASYRDAFLKSCERHPDPNKSMWRCKGIHQDLSVWVKKDAGGVILRWNGSHNLDSSAFLIRYFGACIDEGTASGE